MLYVVPAEQLLGSNISANDVTVFKALSVTSKGDYMNKLRDFCHSHSRCLKAFVKSGVATDHSIQRKDPVSFKKIFMLCDTCCIAKTTRAVLKCKIGSNMTVGSVCQTDISGNWATPSLQDSSFTLCFFEWNSRKIFLYFSKLKVMFAQTKDAGIIDSEVPTST